MILNVRATLWGIFGILFILSITFTAFAQQEQQSDAALSQSQFMQIIDRIDKSEDRMRKHVDEKFDALDKKFDALETKFHELDKKVAVIRSDVDKLFTIIMAIAGAVGLHLLIFVGSHIYSYWRNKANVVSKVAAESREESDEDIGRGNLTDNRPSESEFA
ncbi:hypothetical protein C6503_00380 [Candidatus Poribacteria bacterium]|nr:MAG: hypothetical protein C6503_00380 [Candidatus Poribacteria bacterium]